MIYVLRYALIALYTLIWGLPATLIGPFDRRGRIVCWIARRWVRWIFATCGIRVEVEGVENIDPHKSYVFMSNHQSVADIGAIVSTLPADFNFVAKKELGWVPFFGWALASSVGVMVDRSNHARSLASLQRAAEKIRAGTNVIIFPEGTRSRSGALQEFKSGGFHLAIQAGVPVYPATVSGSRRIAPKGSLRVESGTVKIVYGKPIATEAMSVEDRGQLKAQVRRAIEAGFDPAFQNPPTEDPRAA